MLPDGWTVKKLADCCLSKPKYGANASAIAYNSSLPRYIRITDITDDGRLDDTKKASVNLAGNEQYILKHNDFVFARSGATVGKSYLHHSKNGLAIYAGYLIKIELNQNIILPQYLQQYTKSSHYWHWIKNTIKTGAQPNINAAEYSKLPILLPPLPKQRYIVKILATWDQAIMLTQQLITAKQQHKKGLMQQLLTGKQRFAEFKANKALNWQQVRIKDIGTVITGYTPATKNKNYYGNKHLFVSPLDLGEAKYITKSKKMLSQLGFKQCRKVKAGSILFTCIGSTIGKMGIATKDLATNQQINSIQCNKNVSNEYIYYALSVCASYIKQLANVQAVPIVNKTSFQNQILLLPTLPEQRKIAHILQTADEEITLLNKKLAALKQQKKGLMQQLLIVDNQ